MHLDARGWVSGMLLSTVQPGRLAPTTKCDQAPEAPPRPAAGQVVKAEPT